MPNNEQSFVADHKIEQYLLSDTHEEGKHKAAFFKQFGFDPMEPENLKESLLNHAATREIVKEEEVPHGKKYVLECALQTPDERNPCIKSVWIIGHEASNPGLVTAYPKN